MEYLFIAICVILMLVLIRLLFCGLDKVVGFSVLAVVLVGCVVVFGCLTTPAESRGVGGFYDGDYWLGMAADTGHLEWKATYAEIAQAHYLRDIRDELRLVGK